ncbi:hypothetical protein SASPL_148748 [Salvia splendens]|uniref:Uncharacterized protein n=1 Tax=Salvia splendens TaxID=180675 RepID=A0A8X8Z3P0_SALSN|nr:hypothetical protein SASPL_148748 [Salvia splendens]
MNTVQIPQILDSETLLDYISKLIAQYKEQHTTAAGQEPTAGRESAPPATERRQAAAAAARREPAAAYVGKELTTAVTRHQPPSYAEVVSNSGTKSSSPTDASDIRRAGNFAGREEAAAEQIAVTKRGRGLIKINGKLIEPVEPEILRYKAFEPILLLGRHRFAGVDMRGKISGSGRALLAEFRAESSAGDSQCVWLTEEPAGRIFFPGESSLLRHTRANNGVDWWSVLLTEYFRLRAVLGLLTDDKFRGRTKATAGRACHIREQR